ncbi:MAG: hypothetical protein QW392_08935 [Candidatus Jordarchaeales archaeon]
MSKEVFMLRYYMGLRVLGWIWIIVVLVFFFYRLLTPSLPVVLFETLTGSGMTINAALVVLLALGMLIEWYGSFKLFTLRRKIRAREEVKASEARE